MNKPSATAHHRGWAALFTRAFILLALTAAVAAPGQAEELLEESLSAEDFQLAGLNKLSEDELAVLNALLGREALPPEVVERNFGREQIKAERQAAAPDEGAAIASFIKGEFSGWSGKTVFALDNGQVWQQRVGGRYRYRADSPAVTINKERFGYYLLINATGRKVGVKRVR